MSKIAVIVLSDTTTEEGLGRVYNALTAVKQFSAGGDEVELYFDGTGVRWIDVLIDPQHPINGLYQSVADHIVAVCSDCANFFGKKDNPKPFGDIAVGDVDYQKLTASGYQIFNF